METQKQYQTKRLLSISIEPITQNTTITGGVFLLNELLVIIPLVKNQDYSL
ncbi:hypothetical protein [Arcticibacterium luteifluviistationis]|uniref:hypothetical protein n=1 Tax=Arcticibacterium luteifluviistationis TaxID=1784714 RepID=UPI0013A6A17F|nr:hypothetical protein [Arcticibacterium luteifluviistationis]